MIDDIRALMDEYTSWLQSRTELRQVGNYVEITTPYLDRHNDRLQIFARKNGDEIVLTDDSYTIEDLRMSGCNVDKGRRQQMLQTVLSGFGVRRQGDSLIAYATPQDFPFRKHRLVQAMLSVNDMFFTAEANVVHLFLEDVTGWLDTNEIRYVPAIKVSGKTGYDHVFDLAIPKSRNAPERFVRAINHPNRAAATSVTHAWYDTRDIRSGDSAMYAFLNDRNPIDGDVISALQAYDVKPVRWSQRDEVREALAA